MSERIVLIDDFVPIGVLVAGLRAAGIATGVRRADRFPAGPGIAAVLAGPEIGRVPAAALAGLPDLRVLMATSAGTDHLPVAAARDRGIAVLRPVDYCTDEVADHTIALIVGLLRATHVLDAQVRAGEWDVTVGRPRRIAGTVLGLIGYGRIARAVAVRAAALGMRVLVTARGAGTGPDGAGIAEFVPLATLLAACDVLSPHVPLTAETTGLIGAAELARMRPGGYVVNVARGGVVDEAALGDALRTGRLAAAALDVLTTEPPAPDDPVLGHPRLVLTPHAAWYSAEVATSLARECAELLAGALRDPPAPGPRSDPTNPGGMT